MTGSVAFEPDVSKWDAWRPEEAVRRLESVDAPWYVAAGWAIDLFLGGQYREHEDLEIAVPSARFEEVADALSGFEFFVVGAGQALPLAEAGDKLDLWHQTWVREPATSLWRLDVFREPSDGDTWICRRDERIRLPFDQAIEHTDDGMPYGRPEIILLYKGEGAPTEGRGRLRGDPAAPRLQAAPLARGRARPRPPRRPLAPRAPLTVDPPPRSHRERMASRDGYFPPESVIRRVGNDPLVPLLGGGAAVLLQVAHPLVAAGVAAHSDFDRNLWRRLIRTLRPLYLVIYGDRREAEAAAAEVRAVHARVEGRTRETLGPFAAGTPYSASDPDLMMWVHATLVETSLAVYHRFVERLTPVEQESYYREMSIVGQLFGLPAQVVPPTLAQFRDYFGDQVSGPEIPVTPPAEAVARVVLAARVPAPLRLTLPSHRLATAGLLPPRLRGEYGLRWGRVHAAALPVAVRSMRTIALPLARIADRVTRSAPLRRGNAAIGSA